MSATAVLRNRTEDSRTLALRLFPRVSGRSGTDLAMSPLKVGAGTLLRNSSPGREPAPMIKPAN